MLIVDQLRALGRNTSGFARSVLVSLKLAMNGYHLQEWSPDRETSVRPSQTARKDIPYAVRRKMLDWARELERKDPLFNTFLERCEQYVIGPSGLRILSASTNVDWAKRANLEWDDWQEFCDIGSRHSFDQLQALIEREVEVAGEVFIHKTFGEFGGRSRPRVQFITSECIETPGDDRAKDKSIFDGVRLNEFGAALSYFYRVEDFSGKVSWKEIPADRMIHVFEPSRFGQVRGMSIVYAVLKDLVDLYEMQDLEMAAAKDHSSVSRFITTPSGSVPAADLHRNTFSQGTQTKAGAATSQTASEYYKTNGGAEVIVGRNGDKMELLQSNRPSVVVQAFWEYVSARAAAGLGLPIEVMVMRSLQGTMARGAFDMANNFFRCRSAARAKDFGKVWRHVVSNTVSLRASQPSDWWRTKYAPPRAINVDVGRNSAALIEEYKTGFWTFDDMVGPYGKTSEDVWRQRAIDYKRAREIEQEEGVPTGTCLPLGEAPVATEEGEPIAITPQNRLNGHKVL